MSLKMHQTIPYVCEFVGCNGFCAGRFKIVYRALVEKNVCCSNCLRCSPPKYLNRLGNFWKLVFWKLQWCSEAQLANTWHPQSASKVVQDCDIHRNYKNLQENVCPLPRSAFGSVSYVLVFVSHCTPAQSALSLTRCGPVGNRSRWPVCWSVHLSSPVPSSSTSCLWWGVAASVNRSRQTQQRHKVKDSVVTSGLFPLLGF